MKSPEITSTNEIAPKPTPDEQEQYLEMPIPALELTDTGLDPQDARKAVYEAYGETPPQLDNAELFVSTKSDITKRQEMRPASTAIISSFDSQTEKFLSWSMGGSEDYKPSVEEVQEVLAESLDELTQDSNRAPQSGAFVRIVESDNKLTAVIGLTGSGSVHRTSAQGVESYGIQSNKPYQVFSVELTSNERLVLSNTSLQGVRLPMSSVYKFEDILTHSSARDAAQLLNQLNHLNDNVVVGEIRAKGASLNSAPEDKLTPEEKLKFKPMTPNEELALRLTGLNEHELEGKSFTDTDGRSYHIHGIHEPTHGITFKKEGKGLLTSKRLLTSKDIKLYDDKGRKKIFETRKLGIPPLALRHHLRYQDRLSGLAQQLQRGEDVKFQTADDRVITFTPHPTSVEGIPRYTYTYKDKATDKEVTFTGTIEECLSEITR